MPEQSIQLKSVYELRVDGEDRPIRYRIPHYQRGFRWECRQVEQLLNDIHDFTRRENPQPEDFYCLQPLVLRRTDDGAYEVVDGQQRLTTLLLILQHFNARLSEKYRQKTYFLEYETRKDLSDFLKDPSEERAASNIDYFHISQAIKMIERWFEQREAEVETIKAALQKQAKLIWYELDPAENAVAAFTRLNVGKIPLTNDELIRALFLRRAKAKDGDPLELKIAYEWDLLEKALQREEFWAFLSNDVTHRGNRISYLFDLVAREGGMPSNGNPYATFDYFSQGLAAKDADPEKRWLEIKRTFMLLEEWFEDRRLYHLVGFLVWRKIDINVLRKLARGTTKKAFRQLLREQIYREITREDGLGQLDSEALRERIADLLADLEYGRDTQRVQAILLLFNLATLLLHPASNMRFQFESFKREEWNIEHVRSIASERPGTWKRQKAWLEQCLGYLESITDQSELQEEIKQVLATDTPNQVDAAFESLYERLLKYFQEADDGEADHTVANLTLLDSHTNKSYKNAPFAVKRQRILSLDRDGIFVPLGTRNVFLKCYSAQVDNVMFWGEDDKEGYLKAMTDTLHYFFMGEWIHA
jgi:hypothetical protein